MIVLAPRSPRVPSSRRARRRLGQHFLTDPGAIVRIVEAVSPRPSDRLVEIGPGQGALTRPLLLQVSRLLVVEVDGALAAGLSRRLGDPPGLQILEADILQVRIEDLLATAALTDPDTDCRLRVVGNLPYSIATAILARFMPRADCVRDLTVMVQKEVADRILAPCGSSDYGAFSVRAALHARCRRLFDLGPGSFSPPPAVDSSVIQMTLQPAAASAAAAVLLAERAFAYRRKTMVNSLRQGGVAVAAVLAALRAAGLPQGVRAQQVSPLQFVQLAGSLQRPGGDL